MGILDQLMEKKDLRIYLDMRIKEIQSLNSKIVEMHDPKDRQALFERNSGRIRELIRLRRLLHENEIKTNAINLWRKFEGKELPEDE